jgi:hypothetical protein
VNAEPPEKLELLLLLLLPPVKPPPAGLPPPVKPPPTDDALEPELLLPVVLLPLLDVRVVVWAEASPTTKIEATQNTVANRMAWQLSMASLQKEIVRRYLLDRQTAGRNLAGRALIRIIEQLHNRYKQTMIKSR